MVKAKRRAVIFAVLLIASAFAYGELSDPNGGGPNIPKYGKMYEYRMKAVPKGRDAQTSVKVFVNGENVKDVNVRRGRHEWSYRHPVKPGDSTTLAVTLPSDLSYDLQCEIWDDVANIRVAYDERFSTNYIQCHAIVR